MNTRKPLPAKETPIIFQPVFFEGEKALELFEKGTKSELGAPLALQ